MSLGRNNAVNPSPARRRLALGHNAGTVLDMACYIHVSSCSQVYWVLLQPHTAELVFAVSLAPLLKAATDQRCRVTGPLSPSLATMCLHELAASSKMSSKSSSMKLRMWLLSSQHGFLTNLGIGSRHTFMASAAASSSMVWVWLGLEGGDRHPRLVRPHQNRASKDVND